MHYEIYKGKKNKKNVSLKKIFEQSFFSPHAVVNVAPICISAIILFLLTSILLKTEKKKIQKYKKNTNQKKLYVMVFLLSAHVVVNI